VNLQYTGKSTLLQMWGHFILSKAETVRSASSPFRLCFETGLSQKKGPPPASFSAGSSPFSDFL
ncbi:MAG TPA: hypothetical protein IAA17_03675, partial [Candidatus Lachnoclostridium stercorigallinarum]|nr:hypothetical protein [Candidatus Lachnoclostridium stercorigallinarum]